MTLILIDLAVVLIGLAMTPILFYRIPKVSRIRNRQTYKPKVSVIIPARNEETNLPLLLENLRDQSFEPYEIICADDDSSDATATIAKSFGAKVISLRGKPEGWQGKTWACQNGADAATGDLLLFLDADVKLGSGGIARLAQAYYECGGTISVQPYHETERAYEQCSMLFNLVVIAANGSSLPKSTGVGLYGPIILISRSDYKKAGGHSAVKNSVTEDMALGTCLKSAAIPYRLFVGNRAISFRMYSAGIGNLLQGWVKNFAAGAVTIPVYLFCMVFFWIASMTSVPIQLVRFALSGSMLWLLYLILYFVWVFILALLGSKVGRFRIFAFLLYPIPTAVFLGVFAVSMFKKAFGIKVIWKGRAIKPERRSCR